MESVGGEALAIESAEAGTDFGGEQLVERSVHLEY